MYIGYIYGKSFQSKDLKRKPFLAKKKKPSHLIKTKETGLKHPCELCPGKFSVKIQQKSSWSGCLMLDLVRK